MNSLKDKIQALLAQTEDEALLQAVYALLQGPEAGHDPLTPEEDAALQAALARAEADVAAGRVVSHEELMKRMTQMLSAYK